MTIDVFLDVNAKPPVTVVPQVKEKEKVKDKITWKPGKDQKFDFVSLRFHDDPPCFGKPHVEPGKITVEDDNTTPSSVGDHPYIVVVKYKNKEYSSASTGRGLEGSDPIIRNKPD